ncbi:MAG TPA: hypothetical protein ENJ20_00710 [Bacteroidetes bacterium]|nr:hypothetical protein [Bacteroidota bacterium]
MRIIIPVLLITAFLFYTCQDDLNTVSDQTQLTQPVANSAKGAKDTPQGKDNTTVPGSASSKRPSGEVPQSSINEANLPTHGNNTDGPPVRKFTMPPIEHHPVPQPPLSEKDSLQLFVTDSLVRFAEKERNRSLVRKNMMLKMFTDEDFCYYTSKDQKIVEAVIGYKKGGYSMRHYFFFNGDHFAFYRRLEWELDGAAPYAQETIAFFKDNNDLFEIQKRRVELEEKDTPNRLLGKRFSRPAVDKKAWKEEIMALWSALFREIEYNEMGFNDG